MVGKKKLMSIKEASEYSGLPVWTIRTLIWERRLKVITFVRRKQWIETSDLDRLIEVSKGN